AEIAVTSAFDVKVNESQGTRIVVQKAIGERCARSWKITSDVGSDPNYPDLSSRDAKVVRLIEARKKARLEVT
ncbi:MAG: hypothetical protein VX203_11360, partial [Pseudomonadota bacterium]|nr:hypothetical protein [Pseudomonadota bacterium]